MNQDKYPGIYAAMGEMEMRRNERPVMAGMEARRCERFPMNEAELKRCERFPMNEMEMRNPMNMGQMGARHNENMHVECIDHETELRDVELAHAYVPFQKFCPTFMPLTALRKGTVFPGLVGVY
jgi:hypothetical protein